MNFVVVVVVLFWEEKFAKFSIFKNKIKLSSFFHSSPPLLFLSCALFCFPRACKKAAKEGRERERERRRRRRRRREVQEEDRLRTELGERKQVV